MNDIQRWAGKTALITGVSLGIGKAVAKRCLEVGIKVLGCARNPEKLEAFKSELSTLGSLNTFICDVSKEEEVNSMFEEIDKNHGGIDILINNAGLGKEAPLLSGFVADWRLMLDVNVLGVLMVTKRGVESMKKKKCEECHIININSISGHRVLQAPNSHVYIATKHALNAISQGLRHEMLLDSLNCRISQVSPGLVETPFLESMHGKEKADEIFSSLKALEADDIAASVMFQLSLPSHAQVQDIIIRGTQQQF